MRCTTMAGGLRTRCAPDGEIEIDMEDMPDGEDAEEEDAILEDGLGDYQECDGDGGGDGDGDGGPAAAEAIMAVAMEGVVGNGDQPGYGAAADPEPEPGPGPDPEPEPGPEPGQLDALAGPAAAVRIAADAATDTDTDTGAAGAAAVGSPGGQGLAQLNVAYIAFDIEVTGGCRLTNCVCELGAAAFAKQTKMRNGAMEKEWAEKEWADIDVDDGTNRWCTRIKPPEHDWDPGPAGTGTHGITAAHVQDCSDFCTVWGEFDAWMKGVMEAMQCEAVCLVAHNAKAMDINFLAHQPDRDGVRDKCSWPDYVKFAWDTLPMAKSTPDFKVDSATKKSKVGTTGYGIAGLYRAVTGTALEGHHDAGVDAAACGKVALDSRMMGRRLNKVGGVFDFPAYLASGMAAKIKLARERELLWQRARLIIVTQVSFTAANSD